MKFLFTFFLAVAILTPSLAQKTIRVNGNTAITGSAPYFFNSAQAAHDAATTVAGDILIIEPWTGNYGVLILTKSLKIYGNGYFLDTNTELKADTRNSYFDNVYFNTGSGGSEMYGITAGSVYVHGVSNITISRNYLPSPGVVYLYNTNKAGSNPTNVSNITITKNWINSVISSSSTAGNTISNVLVNNNLIGGIAGMTDPRDQNWIIRNNSFVSSISSTLVNCVFENNLLRYGGTITTANATYSYNVSIATTFSGGVGNVNNYDIITPVDLYLSGAPGSSADESYQLKPGSFLKTAGSSGSEVGAFGGSTPYIISGIPPIPSITSFVNTATGDASTPVKVTISVKANN